MRLGTQARRGWPFRGAYQAFTFSVPLLRVRLQYSSLPTRKHPFNLALVIPSPYRLRVILQPKGLPAREYLPT